MSPPTARPLSYLPSRFRRFLPFAVLLPLALLVAGCEDDDDGFFPIAEASMNWVLVDQCQDGRGIQAALFETETGRVFPSRSTVWVAPPGDEIDVVIECGDGNQVCFGAETDPSSDFFWGVGIDGNAGCDDCCDLCRDNVVEFDLFCDDNGLRAAPRASGTDETPRMPVRGEIRRRTPSASDDAD